MGEDVYALEVLDTFCQDGWVDQLCRLENIEYRTLDNNSGVLTES